jgi:glycosyltransferase involved in cell wall biosynthesis
VRVLALFHAYVPVHNAGAEVMAHAMLRYLAQQGHEVNVVLSREDGGQPYEVDGVRVHPSTGKGHVFEYIPTSDLLVSHLENTPRATVLGQVNGVPVAHLLHNTFEPSKQWVARKPQLAVYNSEWMRADYNEWFVEQGAPNPVPGIVVRPPVDVAEYATKPGGLVTLVNLFPNKGANTFWRVAERMPDVKFLAVTGGYGEQDIRDLPNVEIIDNVPADRMRDEVYARTRILLVPSKYESWGRVGVEAMCSGIPVIASPTPGLRESLGDAGTFVDPADVDGWVSAIRSLRKPANWAKASKAAKARASELDPTADLETWHLAAQMAASTKRALATR